MKIEDVIYQLENLIEDRKSFINNDEYDDVFKKDIEALKIAIDIIKRYKGE